jgi:hypothetical protein
MGFRQHVPPRWGYPVVCMLAGLALGSCVHPEGHKDLLGFLQDGTTTKKEVETRIGPASAWGEDRIWTYRVGEVTEGFYLSEKKSDWSDARYSLVLEFDPNGVLRRHALINVETRP